MIDNYRYTARSIAWQTPLIALGLSVVVVAFRNDPSSIFPLQMSAILLAIGVGAALEDPAFDLLGGSPSSLLRRRGWRVLVIAPPTIVMWSTLLLWHGTSGGQETLTLVAMFAGLLGLSLGIAGYAGRRTSGRGGTIAAPLVFVTIIVSSIIPARWRPLPLGDVPGGWLALQERWAGVAVVGVLILLISSRDAARRVTRPRRGAGRPGTRVALLALALVLLGTSCTR